MRIGLIDADGHSGFPNLALMKISAFHKFCGDDVEMVVPIEHKHYDKVYVSKVFTFTPDYPYYIDADEIVKGGTGYGIYEDLPDIIDKAFPDYSIYPSCDYAIGFLTRGCIRKCPWCIVPEKEGNLRPYMTWEHIKRPDCDKIVFLDNNVLASKWGIKQIEELSKSNVKIDFNQGMDARLVDNYIAELLSRCHWIRFIRFSCDTSDMIPVIENVVDLFKKHGIKPYRIFVYALIQDAEEALKRIEYLDRLGVGVFAQPYRDFSIGGGEPTDEQKRLARWCNNKAIHKSVAFKDYKG